jgi:hypothetical protein
MRDIIYLILVLFVFTSCAKQTITTYPDWYLNTPVNTDNFLYGEGLGFTKEEAKQNALHNLSSRLLITINSSMKTTTQTSTNGVIDSYNKNIQRDVETKINTIEIKNVKVIKSQLVKNEFLILIQVDKHELLRTYLNKFETNEKIIQQSFTNLKTIAPLKALQIINFLKPHIKNNLQNAAILNSLKSDFHFPNYSNIFQTEAILKQNNSIYIHTTTQVSNELISFLNSQGYSSNNNKNNLIKIDIHSFESKSKIKGWYITKVKNTIMVYSKDELISTTIINCVGRSSLSFEEAKKSAANDFRKKIEQLGINKILFSK